MKYTDGWRYRVDEGFAYKLHYDYMLEKDFVTEWFAITTDNWLLVMPGYASDGATYFPDFDWIKTPAIGIHDPLCNAIEYGGLAERFNPVIDMELEQAILGNMATRKMKKWLLRLRGWYVRKGTNLANSRKGTQKKVKELPKLAGEMTLKQYYEMKGI